MSDNVGDDIYPETEYAGGKSGVNTMPALSQSMPESKREYGAQAKSIDTRKYRYDALAARKGESISWGVTKADRMSANEAGDKLEKILDLFKLRHESPAVISAFIDGMFLCHTINSGSVLQPARSVINIEGSTFDFNEIVKYLGPDLRRFFRAFADDIANLNRRVLDNTDLMDPVAVEKAEWVREVAIDRGMQRHPHLCHDSADKCLNITPTERVAIANSKISVFSTIINAADRLNANSRMTTADNYDTTNLKTVDNTTGMRN